MLKAMIVEDNISFREMVRDWLLTQYPSTEVIEAGSGEEALKWLGFYAFDLVFMDIHLPGENGLEITRKHLAIIISNIGTKSFLHTLFSF
jgi:CheY-like chemotaxis protein